MQGLSLEISMGASYEALGSTYRDEGISVGYDHMRIFGEEVAVSKVSFVVPTFTPGRIAHLEKCVLVLNFVFTPSSSSLAPSFHFPCRATIFPSFFVWLRRRYDDDGCCCDVTIAI